MKMNLNSEFHSVAEYYVCALAGLAQIKAIGEESCLDLQAQNVSINAFTSELEETGANANLLLQQTESGGLVEISANGASPAVSINASPSEGELFSGLTVNAEGVYLSYGIPGIGGVISMNQAELMISCGEYGVGSSITMTPESITFKVGETQMTMTAEGIVTTAPSVEVNCEDTNVAISPAGITEEVGEVTRVMTAEGHNLAAAEVEMNVGVEGVTAESPTSTSEFEGTTEVNTATLTQAIDGMISVDAPITMVE